MKFQLMSILVLLSTTLSAQSLLNHRDTLLREDAEGTSFQFTDIPVGNDTTWVNYDQDHLPSTCATNLNPKGWYIGPQAGQENFINPDSINYMFTSCSYLENTGNIDPCGPKNRDWLITPPIHIAGANPVLAWKSLSYQGPAFMDGYKVLVSTTDNIPEHFTDTLFVAAEMLHETAVPKDYSSLAPADYLYSPGYVHANGYSDANYFTYAYDPLGHLILLGIPEPHTVDLSAYGDKTIYIAFLHDSQCDFILQIDDILVSADSTVATHAPSPVVSFQVSPNPTNGPVMITAGLSSPQPVHLSLSDLLGRTLWTDDGSNLPLTTLRRSADFTWLAPGVYNLVLKTEKGVSTRKIIKR
jgi:hypothetical protein